MRVLIIGGTGLISTPMPQLLIERGDSVVLYNRAERQLEPPAGVSQMVRSRTDHERFDAHLPACGEAEMRSRIHWAVGDVDRGTVEGELGDAQFGQRAERFDVRFTRTRRTEDVHTVTLKPHALLTSGAVR